MENNDIFRELHIIKYNLFIEQNVETGFFDVTFEVEGKILYAHKTMLNLVSPTFASMLSDRWITNKEEPIKIKDYGYDDFYQLVSFLYSAQCELTDENIFSMVDIAEFYGVNLLKTYCEKYLAAMEITMDNIFTLMDLADKFAINQLKESIENFIAMNFTLFVESDGSSSKPYNFVAKGLVAAHEYEIEPEGIFQAVYKWCEQQAMDKQSADPNLNLNDTIKSEVSDFLPHIHFREMELKFMNEFIS